MCCSRLFIVVIGLTLSPAPARAQSALPVIEDVDAKALRRQCERLLEVMAPHLGPNDGPALARLASTKDPIPAEYAAVYRLLQRISNSGY